MDKNKQTATAVSPEAQDDSLIHSLNQDTSNGSLFTMRFRVAIIIVLVLGVFTGFALYQNKGKVGTLQVAKGGNQSLSKGQTFGSNDTTTFKDMAEGVLNEGGIGGEGQYHLVRPGGESQNVYLTSSTVDLSQFIGTKIKVWGQTQAAKKAGWLMDVGKVEVEE